MDDDEFEKIMGMEMKREVKKGREVLKKGEEERILYIMVKGRMKVMKVKEEGKKIIVSVVKKGEFLGLEMEMGREEYKGKKIEVVD